MQKRQYIPGELYSRCIHLAFLWVLTLFFIVGCGDSDSSSPSNTMKSSPNPVPLVDGHGEDVEKHKAPPVTAKRLAALEKYEGPAEMHSGLKTRAVQAMTKRLDDLLSHVLTNGVHCYIVEEEIYTADSDSNAPAVSDAAPSNEQAETYSDTNNQVAGVDEADFIKTDGTYIYMVARDNLQIIAAWPPEDARVISIMPIEGEPKKLFLYGDRVIIYSSLGYTNMQDDGMSYPQYYMQEECTYGYNCDFTGDNRELKITTVNISDRANPVVTRELTFSGSYINSRRIGAAVHSVIFFPEIVFPGVVYWPEILDQYCWNYRNDPNGIPDAEIIAAFEALKQKNLEIIENHDISGLLPRITDVRYQNGISTTHANIFDSTNVFATATPTGFSFVTLFSVAIGQNDSAHQVSVLGRPGAVYASASALYMASRQQFNPIQPWFFDRETGPAEASTIHKFQLENGSARCSYSGSGVVKGHVLNQFAMDEREGYLRIATTTGHVPSPNVHSTLSVLNERDGELAVVGQVDDIAPTEDIRSVRFDGPRAFVVTFKKTDPLFAFDLSNPETPAIAGELKIPGFSTYMQLMDENHLLTIGYDAEDQGNFVYFQGIILQIFDITDMAAPELTHKAVIGTRGSSSEAATNHLAFNYYAPQNILALPMTVCEDSHGGGSYGSEMSFSGLLVYDVTTDAGFNERGRISHMDENSNVTCANWWTNSSSVVQRSIVMEDYMYSVSLERIKIRHLDHLEEDGRVVELF